LRKKDSVVTPTDAPPPFKKAYFDTVFVVPSPPREWPRVFAVVTAHNPDGQLAPHSANDEYGRALHSYLRERGIESFGVVGASPDLSHHEAGRGFAAPSLEEAAAISARFRQEAFFWVEDDVVFICTDASGKGWEMGRWSERLVGRRAG
jgi:hypothetical protein